MYQHTRKVWQKMSVERQEGNSERIIDVSRVNIFNNEQHSFFAFVLEYTLSYHLVSIAILFLMYYNMGCFFLDRQPFDLWPQTNLWWCLRWLHPCPLAPEVTPACVSAPRSDPSAVTAETWAPAHMNGLFTWTDFIRFSFVFSFFTLWVTDMIMGGSEAKSVLSSFSEKFFFRWVFSCSASYRSREKEIEKIRSRTSREEKAKETTPGFILWG